MGDMPMLRGNGMSAMDKINQMKQKAKEAMSGGKADSAVDKAGDTIDEKTGRKHSENIDKGAEMAKEKMRGDQQQR